MALVIITFGHPHPTLPHHSLEQMGGGGMREREYLVKWPRSSFVCFPSNPSRRWAKAEAPLILGRGEPKGRLYVCDCVDFFPTEGDWGLADGGSGANVYFFEFLLWLTRREGRYYIWGVGDG